MVARSGHPAAREIAERPRVGHRKRRAIHIVVQRLGSIQIMSVTTSAIAHGSVELVSVEPRP